MNIVNDRLQELEAQLFAKMKSTAIDELQIRDELVLKLSLVVKAKKKSGR